MILLSRSFLQYWSIKFSCKKASYRDSFEKKIQEVLFCSSSFGKKGAIKAININTLICIKISDIFGYISAFSNLLTKK
jgi:hypothetical protein